MACGAAVLLAACGGGSGSDADSGPDGDADSDTDTGTEMDSDTGPEPAGAPVWNARGNGLGVGSRVAFAPDGGLALAGRFRDTIDFGAGAMTSAGENDGFVARYDEAGNCLWSVRLGGATTYDNVEALGFDASGDLLVGGYYYDQATLDDEPLPTASGLSSLLATLSDDGEVAWTTTFGAGFVRDLDTGPDGEIGLMVEPTGPVDFGGGVLSGGSDALALAVLDASGGHRWSRMLEEVTGGGIAFAPDGGLVLGGGFSGTIDIGLGPLSADSSTDGLVAGFDVQGGTVFANRFGENQSLFTYTAAVGPGGRIAVGGNAVPSGGSSENSVFVEVFAPGGEPLPGLALRFGALDYGAANGVAIDPWGNLVLAGLAREGTVDFGCGSHDVPLDPGSPWAGDMALAKLGPGGECLWSWIFGHDGDQSAWGVAVAGSGRVALAGQFQNEVDFGLGPLSAEHYPEPCVAVFEP
jgi:hypothetical protein